MEHLPEKYFNKTIYEETLSWFNQRHVSNRQELKNFFDQESNDLSKAFQYLLRINTAEIHDDNITGADDLDLLRNIDENIHPVYLRLVEAVFSPLIKPVAFFSRIDRNKSTEGLEIYSSVGEIKTTQLRAIVEPYNHDMRNGIAHGGIRFHMNEIEYIDKKGNSVIIYNRDVIKIFDELVDVCNSVSLAIKVFLLSHKTDGYKFPLYFLIEELMSETETNWISVEGCVETAMQQGKQLIIYVKPNSTDVSKIQFLLLHIAILAECLAPGFDRYFLSIKSELCMHGWAIFNGKKLQEARESQANDDSKYINVFESNGLFIVPNFKLPKLIYQLDNLKEAIYNNFKVQIDIFRKSLLKAQTFTKNCKMHRNSWGMVLSGEIVIEVQAHNEIAEYIRANCNNLIAKVFKKAKKDKSLFSVEKYLPLGYARISVFSKQLRKRQLSGYGLGDALVCTIQIQRIERIKSPDIFGSQIEQIGRYRIAWNRNWLTNASGRSSS